MNFALLLGAGFSRNWGGWLANEAFEYILGTSQVSNNADFRRLLWKHHDTGGFEGALSEIQADFRRDPANHRERLQEFQSAVQQMFADMNSRFKHLSGGPAWDSLQLYLDRFDIIFSLNQDVWMELSYLHTVGHQPRHRKWKGASLPGVLERDFDPTIGGLEWAKEHEINVAAAVTYDLRRQPFIKLHGSSNWVQKGSPLMVIGGQKLDEIGRTPILKGYLDLFEHTLSVPDTRLMVIGYGFRDDHVNAAMTRAASAGLRIFIVDPAGSSLGRVINPTRSGAVVPVKSDVEKLFESALIGASRRSILDIFAKKDMIEYDKLERFFRS